jgi:hypothetical protein
MVVTGAKSEDDSRLVSRKYARIVQKLGFDAKFSEFKIQNIVGSCDVKFPIRLEGLAYSHGQFSSYEPEVSIFSPFSYPKYLISVAVVPGTHLPHDQTKSGVAHLRVREDCLDWCKGVYPFPTQSEQPHIVRRGIACPRSSLDAGLFGSFSQFLDSSGSGLNRPLTFLVSHGPQVREEIYTAFNTIYTVLCEFRKP